MMNSNVGNYPGLYEKWEIEQDKMGWIRIRVYRKSDDKLICICSCVDLDQTMGLARMTADDWYANPDKYGNAWIVVPDDQQEGEV